MAPRLLTILTGRNRPKIRQSGEAVPSIVNAKAVADFTRVVEQTGILQRGDRARAEIGIDGMERHVYAAHPASPARGCTATSFEGKGYD